MKMCLANSNFYSVFISGKNEKTLSYNLPSSPLAIFCRSYWCSNFKNFSYLSTSNPRIPSNKRVKFFTHFVLSCPARLEASKEKNSREITSLLISKSLKLNLNMGKSFLG